MLLLAIDLETSGLIDRNLPLDHQSQPHIVELGMVLVDDADVEVGVYQSLIKPTDWHIGDEVAQVHGITTEDARANGVGIKTALVAMMGFVERADLILAHNLNYERQMIHVELMRLRAVGDWWKQRNDDMRCTMEGSKDVLKLPGRYGDWKYPKLSEAHGVLCPGVPFKTEHRSLGDARAALRVWRALQQIEREKAA